jgi:PAS domain S-box-containing protein
LLVSVVLWKGKMKNTNKNEHIFAPLQDIENLSISTNQYTDDTLSIIIDAFNSSINGIIVTNLSGTIKYANPAFCRIFEYSSNEVAGKNATELFTTNEVRTFSDVIEIINMSRELSHEFIVERKNGERIFVEVSAASVTSVAGNTVGRMASFIDITKRKEIENDREELIKKLQHALDTIKVLRGIIPICASCKKIRDDKGYWNHLETYLRENSEAVFSHGICPDCSEKLYGDYSRYKSH